MNASTIPDLILHSGRITTLDPKIPEANNLAIKDGKVVGDVERTGSAHSARTMGAGGRRLDRVSIRGTQDAHPGGSQRGGT